MNTKVIKKILDKKHKDFCDSITDTDVKKLVKHNSIITGGSIVSMLLNEPVKDFDYYFTNKETVLAVAEYYVKLFCKNNPDKTQPVVEVEDTFVRIIVPSKGMVGEKDTIIENGAVPYEDAEEQNAQIADILGETAVVDVANKAKYRPIFLSENAITLSDKVQLVLRFYGNPEEIHKNYDFVHCTNYWESEQGKLVLNAKALESILTKTIYYQGSLYPLCSVIRTRKFIKRGWHINAGQYLKMCFQISKLELTNIKVLREQLTGVDALYFHQVITACQARMDEDNTFSITAPYLCEVIDRIFQ